MYVQLYTPRVQNMTLFKKYFCFLGANIYFL